MGKNAPCLILCPSLSNSPRGVTAQTAHPVPEWPPCMEDHQSLSHPFGVTVITPLHVTQGSTISNSLLGATTSSRHIPWLILKSRGFKDVFLKAAVSEGSWPRLLAGGDSEPWTRWTSEGRGCDEKQDARLECSAERLCDFSGLSLSILFSISVLVFSFIFFWERNRVQWLVWQEDIYVQFFFA